MWETSFCGFSMRLHTVCNCSSVHPGLRSPNQSCRSFSLAQAGTLALNKECCAVDAVVRLAAANGLITARSRGIALRTELAADAPLCIFTDPDRLGQVSERQALSCLASVLLQPQPLSSSFLFASVATPSC
jgi:hypothetical protein